MINFFSGSKLIYRVGSKLSYGGYVLYRMDISFLYGVGSQFMHHVDSNYAYIPRGKYTCGWLSYIVWVVILYSFG